MAQTAAYKELQKLGSSALRDCRFLSLISQLIDASTESAAFRAGGAGTGRMGLAGCISSARKRDKNEALPFIEWVWLGVCTTNVCAVD